jgi:hypothetical protein
VHELSHALVDYVLSMIIASTIQITAYGEANLDLLDNHHLVSSQDSLQLVAVQSLYFAQVSLYMIELLLHRIIDWKQMDWTHDWTLLS